MQGSAKPAALVPLTAPNKATQQSHQTLPPTPLNKHSRCAVLLWPPQVKGTADVKDAMKELAETMKKASEMAAKEGDAPPGAEGAEASTTGEVRRAAGGGAGGGVASVCSHEWVVAASAVAASHHRGCCSKGRILLPCLQDCCCFL